MNPNGVVTTIEEFQNLVDGIRARRAVTQSQGLSYRAEFYRGQVDTSWSIIPSISRNLKTPQQVVTAEQAIMIHFKAQIAAHNYLNRVFLHNPPLRFQNEWAWLIQAQHYRIPTRMLDWTIHPEVALFFAVEDPSMDNIDGQFLVIYYPLHGIKIEGAQNPPFYHTNPTDVEGTWMMNPSFYAENASPHTTAEARRARQHGKFSIQQYDLCLIGLDKQASLCRSYFETFDPVIEKYIIPAQFKGQLRLDMAAKGWHGEWLYKFEDDIINNISNECKEILANIVKT